jgi:hypothetical protein
MLHARRSLSIRIEIIELSIVIIIPDEYGPGVHSTTNRNEYQESSRGKERLKISPPFVGRLYTKCAILDASQMYGPPSCIEEITLQMFLFVIYRKLLMLVIHICDTEALTKLYGSTSRRAASVA